MKNQNSSNASKTVVEGRSRKFFNLFATIAILIGSSGFLNLEWIQSIVKKSGMGGRQTGSMQEIFLLCRSLNPPWNR